MNTSPPPPARRPQRGAVLLGVVILLAASAAMSSAMLSGAFEAAAELGARRDVLCARFAALGGLALGTATTGNAAALIGPDVESLVVSLVRINSGWCLLRATARCGRASRMLERTLPDPSACDG